jgi:two-component system, cell cycle response regulator DivK
VARLGILRVNSIVNQEDSNDLSQRKGYAAMKRKVLIVEDNSDCREILVLYLQVMGCQALKASNGREAIMCALAEHPDIIFTDLGLPDLDGVRVASTIKQNPDTSHIPIVALTAWDTVHWKEKASKAGITKYLVKPVSPLALREAIEEFTQQPLPNEMSA